MKRTRVSPIHTEHAKVGKMIEGLQSDLAAARSHAKGRERRVGQVMCHLSLMRSAGVIQAFFPVTLPRISAQILIWC